MFKRFMRTARRSVSQNVISVDITNSADLIEATHWIEHDPLRIYLPAKFLRMQGAFVYDKSHPFVMAFTEGEYSLQNFYTKLVPSNVIEYYGISMLGRSGEDLPPWEVPWYKRKHRRAPGGEGYLSADHGVSFYGPASREKISLEMQRLRSTFESIRKKGYQPDEYGDIEGYVMKHGDNACFFVRGGKHRAAVLSYLGYERISVKCRLRFPKIVDIEHANYWPLVHDGSMDVDLARAIFLKYFKIIPI